MFQTLNYEDHAARKRVVSPCVSVTGLQISGAFIDGLYASVL